MKLESNTERIERLRRENAVKIVPGRTLLKGYQWNGLDSSAHGNAPARRLRQAARQAAKQARKAEREQPKVEVQAPEEQAPTAERLKET